MIYDLIIIGAGAAGLFAGATLPARIDGLILEKGSIPGRKLLMSGGGQCNFTHGGSIKDFITHYGKQGGQIRPVLYRFNNQAVIDFFEEQGVASVEREDGKVFPKSLRAQDVIDALTARCVRNGLKFGFSSSVTGISAVSLPIYSVHCGDKNYRTRKLIIATGGCSYPTTGSDGRMFSVLEDLGIRIEPPRPALVPIYVRDYPYSELPGISFDKARITLWDRENRKIAENTDALLLTHECFSGPAILNCSRYASAESEMAIDYFPEKTADSITKELTGLSAGNPKQLMTVLYEYFNPDQTRSPAAVPKRFLETICRRAGMDPARKSSQVSGAALKSIVRLLTDDRHSISRLAGYETAMVTAGGIALSEVNLKTMEAKNFPGLYFAGEALDVDGDTGGYNLQFAFSSGHLAAQSCT